MRTLFLHLCATGFSLLMLGLVALVLLLYHFGRDLPDYGQLADYNPAIVTRLYAANGQLLEEYSRKKRIFVPITAMPEQLKQAFISAEDKNFYTHPGIDLVGIGRAVLTNVMNLGRGRSLVGGSTITQQVVKNFLLSNEKTLTRKAREAILAFRISRIYSKERVLELYLNEIYLGGGSYGVAAAALNYFNKSIDELTLEESALLATLPKAPSRYDPRKNYEQAKTRRDWVITRMTEDGYIDAEEAQEAMETPIVLRDRDPDSVVRADYFAEAVRRQLEASFGEKTLYEGGLVVRTTVNPTLQGYAEKAFRKGIEQYDKKHGYRGPAARMSDTTHWEEKFSRLGLAKLPEHMQWAVVLKIKKNIAYIGVEDGSRGQMGFDGMKWAREWQEGQKLGVSPKTVTDVVKVGDVVAVSLPEGSKPSENVILRYQLDQLPNVDGGLVAIDPHTGRVLAMVGGYGSGNTEFNRVIQARRQPGSAFKPFTYLAALERGLHPATIVLDAPIELEQGEGLPMWRPQNYSGMYYGPTTMRVGLEKSRNAMTVRLAQHIGISPVLQTAIRLGIYARPERNYSVVLGSQETTLLNIVNAYAMLANGGKRVEPTLIERIQNSSGKTIYRRDQRACEGCRLRSGEKTYSPLPPLPADERETAIDPYSAYQITAMLEGVVKSGTAVKARRLGIPLAGKTGTTNNSIDAWFVGYTPDLVAGAYVGFDQPRTLGPKETGSSVALPIFIDFMELATKKIPPAPFRMPQGIALRKIDKRTGRFPAPGTEQKHVIFEAFKPGEQPGGPVIGGQSTVGWQQFPYRESPNGQVAAPSLPKPPPAQTPVTGTGGIY